MAKEIFRSENKIVDESGQTLVDLDSDLGGGVTPDPGATVTFADGAGTLVAGLTWTDLAAGSTIPNLRVTISGGESPTEAEFNDLVNSYNNLRNVVNSIAAILAYYDLITFQAD